MSMDWTSFDELVGQVSSLPLGYNSERVTQDLGNMQSNSRLED
jgi:hypothetical protein